MTGLRSAFVVLIASAAIGLVACDRAVEPFDPSEEPEEPDLSAIFPAGSESAAPVAEMPPAPSPRGGRGAPPVASSSAPLNGLVSLAPELADRVPSNAVLFLIARRGDSGPPLAVVRVPRPRFPLEFSIGPEDRMVEAIPFTGPLTLSARVDQDGNATTRTPGDLHGVAPGTFDPGDRGITLVIDEAL